MGIKFLGYDNVIVTTEEFQEIMCKGFNDKVSGCLIFKYFSKIKKITNKYTCRENKFGKMLTLGEYRWWVPI